MGSVVETEQQEAPEATKGAGTQARLAGLGEAERIAKASMVATLMVKAAAEDGSFHDDEREAAETLLARLFGLADDKARALVDDGVASARNESLYSCANAVKGQFAVEDRLEILKILKDIVAADGILHDFELGVLHRLAVFLDVPYDPADASSDIPVDEDVREEWRTNAFANCLSPLLDSLGWRGSQRQLAEALPHAPEDMGLTEFLNTLANLKFEGRVVKTRLKGIDARLMPCLFVSDAGDAMVLLAPAGDNEILAFNGAKGEYTQVKRGNVSGSIILFKGMKAGAQSFLRQQTGWFTKVLFRFKALFFLAVILSLLLAAMAMVLPLFVMTFYDQVSTAGSFDTLGFLGVGVTVFIFAEMGFRFLRSHVFRFASVRLGNLISNEVVRRILYLPMSFTETANLGAQVSRIKDFETVREFFGGPAVISVIELPFMLLLVGGLFFIGGPVAFVPLSAVVFFILFGFSMMPVLRQTNADGASVASERQAFIVETYSNLRAIKALGATKIWSDRYREMSAEATMGGFESAKVTEFINAVTYALVMFAGVGTMAVGVTRVIDQSMTSGALMASMILVWRILSPLRSGFNILTQIGRIKRSIIQVNRLMNMPQEVRAETSTAMHQDIEGRVAFSRVALRYSPDAPPALVGVDFKIAPGEALAIVGHDGAGKSTVLKLIMGLYTPQAGQVLIDNSNVKQMDPVVLRHGVAYAPQGTYEFYGTIRQNLLLANPAANDDDLRDAIAKAGILKELDNLPDGLETRIGDHNVGLLSLEFRRRLGLARAFLRDSKLLLLDEPELGADAALLDTINDIKGKRTVIVATHDIRFFNVVDKVVWLENGRIRKAGPTHEVAKAYFAEYS
ncbi:MAG: ABC transporter transmembrane domain-containing protein [Rhodospirillales bacterium]